MLASISSGSRWCPASIRKAKGISLEQIAGRTKLRVAIIKAIEDGNFDELPGGIYNISYLRQYAREIGADENLLVRWYEHGFTPPANSGVENDSLAEMQRSAPTYEEVAQRAYLLWQQRGCPNGNADEDWFQAERQLMSAAN
jgi:cytoskeletal protein RodZ